MAIGSSVSVLTSSTPSAIASANVHIGHVQLRDLIVCPRERGVVNYVKQNSLMELNLCKSHLASRKLVDVPFTPNALTSMIIPGTDDTLLAAGGQEAEIHVSCYSSRNGRAQLRWHYDDHIRGSINNSLLLTSLSMTASHESSAEPRVAVSNNDGTVRFFEIPVRHENFSALLEVGSVNLHVPINHSSISPDGRTLLSVGDTSKIFLHRLTGGAQINISSIATLSLPAPLDPMLAYSSAALVASFSTSFSSDGTKYAVGSQEGIVAIWDVRSSKPLKTFQTDYTRAPLGNGGATGWLSDDPWEWARGSCKAPGWSVRNVKFSKHCMGKEVLTFTEHTSLVHVVDARTFETEEVVQVPYAPSAPPPRPIHRPHPVLTPPPEPPSYMITALDIPSSPAVMGDRYVETDVQVLLSNHSLRTMRHSDDADELDCFTPSRSSSPSPSANIARHSFSPPVTRPRSLSPSLDNGLDIAGVCFDPEGAHVYVATTESVAEWEISGAEKRWWVDDGWV